MQQLAAMQKALTANQRLILKENVLNCPLAILAFYNL